MIKIVEDGIRLCGERGGIMVPWSVLEEHGIFNTTTVVYYAEVYPSVLEDAVWSVWRKHIVGE